MISAWPDPAFPPIAARPPVPNASLLPTTIKTRSLHGVRIVVVEDDALIGLLLAQILEDLGLVVCAVETSEPSAVAAVMRYRPDIMIVDVMLGSGSGLRMVALTKMRPTLPYILMSGLKLPAGGPGAAILQKPFRKEELVRALQQALSAMPHEAT